MDPVSRMCQRVMTTPGGRTWWGIYRGEFNQAFASEIDGLLAQAPASAPITAEEWRSHAARAPAQRRGAL